MCRVCCSLSAVVVPYIEYNWVFGPGLLWAVDRVCVFTTCRAGLAVASSACVLYPLKGELPADEQVSMRRNQIQSNYLSLSQFIPFLSNSIQIP